MNNNNKLFASTELIGAIITNNLTKTEISEIKINPNEYIKTNLNCNLDNINFNLVDNNHNNINLILPYYSDIDTMQCSTLDESSLENVSGGEIFVTLSIVIGGAIGFGIAGTCTGLTVGGTIGGIIGITAVATTVVATTSVVATEKKKANGSK